jgi:hypothetical protein
MQFPRRFRAQLFPLIGRKSMREETRAVLFLDSGKKRSDVKELLSTLTPT